MSEPTVPLSEIRVAYWNDAIPDLLAHYAPLPEPLLWSIAKNAVGDVVVVTSANANEFGVVDTINMSDGSYRLHNLSNLIFTGEHMVGIKDTPEQPELPLKTPQGSKYGLLGKWATHPKHGRGVITNQHADTLHKVTFTHLHDNSATGAYCSYVPLDDLTLDDDSAERFHNEQMARRHAMSHWGGEK